MKKVISVLLVCAAVFSLCICGTSALAAENDSFSPTPAKDPAASESEYLEMLMGEFAENLQPGTAGSSLKAVKEAVRLMDWGMESELTFDEISDTVEKYFKTMDAPATDKYIEQLAQLDETYQLLLTDGQEELLESAGCTDTAYPWGGEFIPAVEAFFIATNERRLYGTYTGDYTEFLETYYQAIDEEWPIEELAMAGINFKVYEYFGLPDLPDCLGFTVRDINSDGTEELLIGFTDDATVINDMYTICDNEREMVIQGGDYNDKYYVCNDGTICRYTYRNNDSYGYHYYNLNNGWLVPFGCIIYDKTYAPQNFWYIGADDDWNINNDTPFPPDWAMQKVESYEKMYVDNEYIPFSALHE